MPDIVLEFFSQWTMVFEVKNLKYSKGKSTSLSKRSEKRKKFLMNDVKSQNLMRKEHLMILICIKIQLLISVSSNILKICFLNLLKKKTCTLRIKEKYFKKSIITNTEGDRTWQVK